MRSGLRKIRCGAGWRGLPDAADAELVEFGVEAEDGDVEREGLGGEDAVEGISVFGAEPGGTKCGFTVDGKYGIACLIHCFEEPGFKGDGIRQLSTANFGRD